MGWVLRLVESGTEGSSGSVDVLEIERPGDLGDLANLGLTHAEGKQLLILLVTLRRRGVWAWAAQQEGSHVDASDRDRSSAGGDSAHRAGGLPQGQSGDADPRRDRRAVRGPDVRRALRPARPAGDRAVASGAGHAAAVPGEPVRSPGRRRGARPDRLEVRLGPGAWRCRL